MFQEHEEVIVFTRDEFSRFYNSLWKQIDYINETDLFLSSNDEWKLLGHWPKVMEKVNILDVNMDSLLEKEPSLQCYLDASLYSTIQSSNKKVIVSKRKVPGQLKLPI
jgi:hypothetical protein